ncbi:MAG: hypothetical protein JEZ09_14740 [Salinivirgaceae bacterium]|nr:hypothetical protein [Salinivirgaceae bacterium]
MKQKSITISDHKIAYFDNKQDSDTTILFLHGNSLSFETAQYENGDSFNLQLLEFLNDQYKL